MSDVTSDLMTKVADDVIKAIIRTLSIAPNPRLPVATSAAAAALGIVAAELDKIAGCFDPVSGPGNDNILLSGLIAARLGMLPQSADSVGDAYKDYETLKAAGRTPVREGDLMIECQPLEKKNET